MTSLDGLPINGGNAVAAILFIQAGTATMDVYSALNSSPWTAESFGGDPAKAASCRNLVYQSMAWSAFYCTASALIAKSWWPIYGMVINNVYMWYLYERALRRAGKSKSTGWADSGSQP